MIVIVVTNHLTICRIVGTNNNMKSLGKFDNKNTGWMESAECRGSNPEVFFPHSDTSSSEQMRISAAKAICNTCIVREECLDYALANPVTGIWGGLTETERRTLLTEPSLRTSSGEK